MALEQARYQVRLHDTSGALVAVFGDWQNLEVNLNVNSFHDHVFQLRGDDERRDYFTTDSIFRVLRRTQELDWYEIYTGFTRTEQDSISEKSRQIFTTYGRGLVDLLHRRTIAYFATTAFTLKSGPGETVLKSYVAEKLE